jgi:hypothetical protein
MERMSGENSRTITVQAKLHPSHQRNASAGLDERLQMSGNLWMRKLIEPVFIVHGLELLFVDCIVQDKASKTIDQRGNDSHLGNDCGTPKRPDRRFAQNSAFFFKHTIGSFGGRSQNVQLPIPLRASGDLQNKARMLRNGNMSEKTKPIGATRTVPVKRILLLHSSAIKGRIGI